MAQGCAFFVPTGNQTITGIQMAEVAPIRANGSFHRIIGNVGLH